MKAGVSNCYLGWYDKCSADGAGAGIRINSLIDFVLKLNLNLNLYLNLNLNLNLNLHLNLKTSNTKTSFDFRISMLEKEEVPRYIEPALARRRYQLKLNVRKTRHMTQV